MDAVQIEHRFGDIWGAKGRGHEADADAVRVGKPEYLAKAISKACKVLEKRLEGLPVDDPLHMWIEDLIPFHGGIRGCIHACDCLSRSALVEPPKPAIAK